MKTLIVLVYFDRPNMVRNALLSIREQSSSDWHLAFIDDGSSTPGRPICEEVLKGFEEQITYYRCDDTPEIKEARGGSIHGQYMNQAIREHEDCEPVMIVCDDDALFPSYVELLNVYYETNPSVKYSYCHVSQYDPLKESFRNAPVRNMHLNYTHKLIPSCTVDSAQVTYRRSAWLEAGVEYPAGTRNLDSSMYSQLHHHYGLCPHNGIMGQYKGWFSGQMSHKPNPYQPVDTAIQIR